MRKHQQLPVKTNSNKEKLVYIIIGLVIIVSIFLVFSGLFGGKKNAISATHLRCVSTQSVTPFGDSVLYYDGLSLVCLNNRGGEKWSYTLGENASFTCSEQAIAAWSGSQLHIINAAGHATYNESLADDIQFARVGSKYVAVVLGRGIGPKLSIKDMQGTEIITDDKTNTYEDSIILDIGFFANGDYLWSTSMDLYSTTPTLYLNTIGFRGHITTANNIAIGDNLVYKIIYAGDKLNVVSTRQLRQFDYRGTQETSGTKLVYGWQLIDHAVQGNQALMLFVPSRQLEDNHGISQLRLLNGNTDKRFTLPSPCIGAALHNKRMYAFSSDTLYRADISGQRFSAISLPAEMNGQPVTSLLGLLKGGTALVTCDNDVYLVTLP